MSYFEKGPLEGLRLTPIQAQRFDSIVAVYGLTAAATIVRSVTGRGRNSWATFLDKMDYARRMRSAERDYFDALYETFELNQVYSPKKIISYVSEIRRDMDLQPYSNRIKLQCERDFFAAFIVEDVYETLDNSGEPLEVFVGHKPVAKVKA